MITMLACATLIGASVSPLQEASAAPQDITNLNLATWNMRGGTDGGGDSKWTTGVAPLSAGRPEDAILPHNIVAVQEAGSAPPGSHRNVVAQLGNLQVTESLWQINSENYRYVYFMETDANGHRVNLAMVTDRAAHRSDVLIVPPGLSDGRASFGLRFGTTWFFTVHGLSGSGNDVPGLLRNIVARVGNDSWIALGDFNRDPSNLAQAMPVDNNNNHIGVIASTGEATYYNRTGSELDYMVTSGDLAGILAPSRLPNLGGSDHIAVQFGSALAAAATQFQITASDVPPGTGATVQMPSPAAESILDDDLHGGQNWHFQNYDPTENTAQIANSDPNLGCMVFKGNGALKTAPCVQARDEVPPEQKMTVVDADVPGEGHDVQIKPAYHPDSCLYATYYKWQQPGYGFSGRNDWRNCRDFSKRAAADEGGGNHWTLAPVRRVMIVGDSITQGHEGDFTWRYRLWQWFRSQRIAVDFVGPYSGTFTPDQPAPPTPPLFVGEKPPNQGIRVQGGYADGVAFDSDHFAHWGRQAAQIKLDIRQQVQNYQPDLVLLAAGFNDMGWFVSDEHGTLDSVKTIIDEARAARPWVDFAVANVPQRSIIDGRDDLITKTDNYSELLKRAVPQWNTAVSPVVLVDWRNGYSCEPQACRAGYDGLHPNAYGEYQLATAFEQALHTQYGIGTGVMPFPPENLPVRPTPVPTGLKAVSSPLGVTVTWDPVYGAFGYEVRSRIAGQTSWGREGRVNTNRTDTTWTVDGIQWEYQVRTVGGDKLKGPWSGTVSAVAHPQTAPPPRIIGSGPSGPDGVELEVRAPEGPYTDTIDRYGIILFDRDTPGAWLTGTGFRGEKVRIDGLKSGHRYIVAADTWNAVGGGLPGLARPVKVGAGIPEAPTNLRVTTIDPTSVELDWDSSANAAGYRLWVRYAKDGGVGPPETDENIIDDTHYGVGFLFPGAWYYEFCVTAINGSWESGKSNCVVPSHRGDAAPTNPARRSVPPNARTTAADIAPLTTLRNPDGTRNPVALGIGIHGGDR